MPDERLILASLTEFVRTLVAPYGIADVWADLAEQVAGTLALADAGVSIVDDRNVLRFVTASSDAVVDVERVQEATQEGPCAYCFHACAPVTSSDLQAEERWPEYQSVAVAAGYRAAAALPLRAKDRCVGSLNLYDTEPREWSEDDLNVAGLFADMAASYVANASDLQRSERIREQLQEALETRVVIEQAKGLLAGQLGISVDKAYHVLRTYTRQHRARLHDVAYAVVKLGLRVD